MIFPKTLRSLIWYSVVCLFISCSGAINPEPFEFVLIKENSSFNIINQNDVSYYDTIKSELHLTKTGIEKIRNTKIADTDSFNLKINGTTIYQGIFVNLSETLFDTKLPIVFCYPNGPIHLVDGQEIRFKCYQNENKKCRLESLKLVLPVAINM